MINNGEVEPNRISKTVLVIDEAQDMGKDDYALVNALMEANEEMRVIAVGDDDQNIYEFRGSNSQYLYELTRTEHSRFIEMTENYRSLRHIVDAANDFARNIRQRMKSDPIISMSQEDGEVRIVKHPYQIQEKRVYMYQPILEEVMRLLGNNASKEPTKLSTKRAKPSVFSHRPTKRLSSCSRFFIAMASRPNWCNQWTACNFGIWQR